MCPVWYLCTQYVKPWPYTDIRSCCHRSLHAFTFRHDSTVLGRATFYTESVLHEILSAELHNY